MHEEDSTFTNQRADDDLVHSSTRAWTCDKRTSDNAALRAPPDHAASRGTIGSRPTDARMAAPGDPQS